MNESFSEKKVLDEFLLWMKSVLKEGIKLTKQELPLVIRDFLGFYLVVQSIKLGFALIASILFIALFLISLNHLLTPIEQQSFPAALIYSVCGLSIIVSACLIYDFGMKTFKSLIAVLGIYLFPRGWLVDHFLLKNKK